MATDALNGAGTPGRLFCTTHWTVVLAAQHGDSPDAQLALEALCHTYWYPLYAFVRRRGYGVEDAQDLTQEFFLKLLKGDFLRNIAREKGRFRTFLLASLNHFLASAWERGQAAKRGGGQKFVSWDELQAEERYAQEPEAGRTPEQIYQQRWAISVMEQALARLREELEAAGKGEQFERLQPFLAASPSSSDYLQAAGQLGMTANAARVAVHRLRRRFGELMRSVVAHTVAAPDEVEDELQVLIQALSA